MHKVKIIQKSGAATMVEFLVDGALQRCYVPAQTIILEGDEHYCDEAELTAGIPYGVEWGEVIRSNWSPERFTNEMRRRGVWNFNDLRKKQQEALAAIQSAYGVDLARLNSAARQGENNGK